MGCFLHCFGASEKKRRPRKAYNKILVKDIIRGSYEHLDSTLPLIHQNAEEDDGCSETQFRGKVKTDLRPKIRKKVTFNLNVQVFEPVLTDYHLLENDKEEEEADYGLLKNDDQEEEEADYGLLENDDQQEEEEEADNGLLKKDDQEEEETDGVVAKSGDSLSAPLSAGVNYRYQNCCDGYDEDDERAFDDCDFDDEIEQEIVEDYDDIGDYFDCLSASLDDFSERLGSISLKESKKFPVEQLHTAEKCSGSIIDYSETKDEENKVLVLNENARDRSNYVHSVLNPIENLTQWKAVKGVRGLAAVPRQQRNEKCAVEKESSLEFNPRSACTSKLNQTGTLKSDGAIDASLSNWLA